MNRLVKGTEVRKPVSNPVNIKVDIRPEPTTPSMRVAWTRAWSRLIAKALSEDAK
jgi:hypothetical protein